MGVVLLMGSAPTDGGGAASRGPLSPKRESDGVSLVLDNKPEGQSYDASVSQEQRELYIAQKQAADELAKYYREQAKVAANRPSTIIDLIKESPGTAVALVAPVLTGLVTLLVFALNYRSQLKNQRDTQFYEALRRFGDRESPLLRTSAAALLAEIGGQKTQGLRAKRPYFETASSQLSTSILLETDPVALVAVQDALHELAKQEPARIIKRVVRANVVIQRACIHAFALCESGLRARGVNHAHERMVELAGGALGCGRDVVELLISNWADEFAGLVKTKSSAGRKGGDDGTVEEALIGELRLARMRLESSVISLDLALEHLSHPVTSRAPSLDHVFWNGSNFSKLVVEGLSMKKSTLDGVVVRKGAFDRALLCGSRGRSLVAQSCSFVGCDLRLCDFKGADFSGSSFAGADLTECNLEGANLSGCDLTGARLWNAKVNSKTNLSGVQWWRANFFEGRSGNPDGRLIKVLQVQCGIDASAVQRHSSVDAVLGLRSK
ncbi:pentapeptide repeat-containing protein [Corallococcus exiguus]|nr:pentapeptide repeat-containing protein [Corallococcus exiguus]NPC71780.1 pentapeptide repeat-containing protein [Corallococcus exiguus]